MRSREDDDDDDAMWFVWFLGLERDLITATVMRLENARRQLCVCVAIGLFFTASTAKGERPGTGWLYRPDGINFPNGALEVVAFSVFRKAIVVCRCL